MPNHIVRVFELHYTYPNNAPVINGLKLVEAWARGITDYLDGNGLYVMENGDRFSTRTALLVQNIAGKLTATNVGNISGGTGKFAGTQGIIRVSTNFDYKTGFNESQTDIEYTVGK